jgi:hypothetical protein
MLGPKVRKVNGDVIVREGYYNFRLQLGQEHGRK